MTENILTFHKWSFDKYLKNKGKIYKIKFLLICFWSNRNQTNLYHQKEMLNPENLINVFWSFGYRNTIF